MVVNFGSASRSHFWLISLRIILAIVFLIGGLLLLRQTNQLGDIIKALKRADWGWVIVGLIATALSYTMASVAQYAAGSWQGSFHKVHMLQWAGNFINRFLPLNIGSTVLMARHYQKQGRPPAEAVTVATLPSIVGITKNLIPILLFSPFTIAHILRQHPFTIPSLWLFLTSFIVVAISILLGRKYRKKIKQFLLQARGGLASIRDPWQLTVLIFGSVAFTLLASTALFAALQAVGTTLPLSDIFTLYILSVLAGSTVPTPGGVGGPEAALVASLTSLGIGISTALSITLLFRLMTFWAPLIPGAIALRIFRKRN